VPESFFVESSGDRRGGVKREIEDGT